VRAVYYPSTSILEILRVICQSVQNAQYSLLLFAGNKRQRWTSTGDLEEFSLEDLGFDKSIAETLRDTENLDQKLKILQEEKLIDRHDSEIRVMEHVNLGWEQWRKVLVLVCFYFSGCEYSTQFSGAGNLALPLFKMLIENYSQQDEKERQPVRHLVLPALVQASKFSNLQWKRECISTMEKEGIENMDIYTRTSFISRKAFVSRSSGDWNGSCQLIRDYLRSLEGQEVDQRLYALKGILLCSLGSSLSERGSFDEADGVWRKWYIPGKPLALFPTRVSVKILVASGKANLQRGNYEIARAVLSSAMEQYPADSRQSLDVLTALSDTYCELGNPLTALDTLRKVSELKGLWELKSVSMKDRCLRNKYEMDYYVSYAEALVCAEFHDEAEQLLSELKSYFAQKGRPDTLERYELRRCLRVAIMLAQNLHRRATERVHWEQTEQRWAAVIEIADSFDETSDWDTGIMLLSRHHTSIQLGRDENTWLEKSINKFKADGRFWMRGMGTYWKSFILSKLPQAANVVPRG
jgi:tetratricopeptide (TPR) repeat protein